MPADRQDPVDDDVWVRIGDSHRHQDRAYPRTRRTRPAGRHANSRSTGNIEAKATPTSGYGNSTAITASTARWKRPGEGDPRVRPAAPEQRQRGTELDDQGEPRPDLEDQRMADGERRDRRPRVAEQALAQVVVGDEAQQPVAVEPVEPAAEAELGHAGDEVGGHGDGAHHLQRPPGGGRRRRGPTARRRARGGAGRRGARCGGSAPTRRRTTSATRTRRRTLRR